MNGVTFGTYHTYDDFGLILSSKEITSPQPKTRQIEIEGSDGFLDMTDFFGHVNYGNRSLSFQFVKPQIVSQADFLTLFSTVENAIHGKKLNIILDDDLNYHYVGRVNVNEWKSDKTIGRIVIEADAEPWKLKNTETVVARSVSGSASITLSNGRKPVVPTITTNAAMTIRFNNTSYSTTAGTFQIPGLELTEGNNTVTVTGTGTITFRYTEGGL